MRAPILGVEARDVNQDDVDYAGIFECSDIDYKSSTLSGARLENLRYEVGLDTMRTRS